MSQPSDVAQALTIITVSYNSGFCLGQSWQLTRSLNEARDFHWLVVENTPSDSTKGLQLEDARFEVLPGILPPDWASYNHAAGLNRALAHVTTRFVLFLDPDFFLVRPHWIRDVLNHMQAQQQSFFGAPWYPTYAKYYRYFPGPACIFVDLERVRKSELDWTPEAKGLEAVSGLGTKELLRWALGGRPPTQSELHPEANVEMARYVLLCRASSVLPRPEKRKPKVGWSRKTRYLPLPAGWSRDTGYRVYRAFYRNPAHMSECAQPSWDNPFYAPDSALFGRMKKFLRRTLTPENFSLYPKQKNYTTQRRFAAMGLPDVRARGWEEYFWRDAPFGFHLRGLFHGLTKATDKEIEQVVSACLPPHQTILRPTQSASVR